MSYRNRERTKDRRNNKKVKGNKRRKNQVVEWNLGVTRREISNNGGEKWTGKGEDKRRREQKDDREETREEWREIEDWKLGEADAGQR